METDFVCHKNCGLKQVAFQHQEMFDNRAERERGQKRQRADENHRADEQHDKREAGHRKRAGAGGNDFFARERPGEREQRHDHAEPAEQHVNAERRVPPRRVGVEAGEGAAVVARAGSVGVKHFAQAVRALIGQTGLCPSCSPTPRP